LAVKYRDTLTEISRCAGKNFRRLHIVGGGAKSALLCQTAADICNIPVTAGLPEATAYGNIIAQLITLGALSREEAQRVITQESANEYLPKNQHGV
jgi:rhamnulokinase/L-fuculokinase